MGDAARGVADGRDGGAFPVEFAVLFFVVEFAAPFLSRLDGSPKHPVGFRAHLAGFQDARILAQHFRQGVTGERDELGIDVFNVPGRIGNDDRGGTLFHRNGQLVEFFLHPLAFGNVAVAAALAEPAPVAAINRLAMMINPAFFAAAGEDAKVQAADLVAGLRDFLVVFGHPGKIIRMGDFQRQFRVGQKFLGSRT